MPVRSTPVGFLNPLAPSLAPAAAPARATASPLGDAALGGGAVRRRAGTEGRGWGDSSARALARSAAAGDVNETMRAARERPESVNAVVGEDGRRALHHAAASGSAGGVEALLSVGAEPEARCRSGRTPLHEAAKNGHADAARKIIDAYKVYGRFFGASEGRRVDVNARDVAGSTPLHEARERRVIEILLREGADGTQRRGDGSNALHLACDRGDGWASEALLGCGVDCDARDGVGRSALHRARDGRSAAALCASGADVDVMNDDGYTPLHVAAMDGRSEVIVRLVSAGAQLRARTRNRGSLLPGATAADLAAKYGHDDVVRLLDGAKQVSRTGYLSTCAINHNEERFVKQMRRSSEKRMGVVWGVIVAVVIVLFALLIGHFWYAEAKRELEDWRRVRSAREKAKMLKAKQRAAAEKAELKRKLEADARAKAWQAEARQHVERVLKCGVYGTSADGVKKGGVHRCILFGSDGRGLSEETSGSCGVCVGFLQDFRESKSESDIDAQLTAACTKNQGNSRVGKICDSLLAARKDLRRQMSFGVPPAKVCARLGAKDPELCAVKPAKEGDLSSDGKGDVAARDAFKRLSLYIHPDKHENSAAATEAFKMLNTARAYMDSKAKLNEKRKQAKAGKTD
ncbi:Ankyrin repeat [Ostreococcus tauri]|uniref:Ankyrin repeat n=1 Tax=Ostreococcus tauri TaxID=70448 RepID=Q013Z1_OSTTA|nr:Ankyrin repeat [Ostreococcus tauri]CAL54788.1 Ankyrin repeat [Ostreococcus tauri]|eukprot:XP_003080620.1 Ankyrin repeat [Ostreococcus tauri]